MKKTTIILALCAAAACVSCNKEQKVIETPESSIEKTLVTLTVSANKAVDTKALAADGAATWTSGEKVLVFKEGKATSIGTLEPDTFGNTDTHLTGPVDLTGVSEGDKLDLIYVSKNTVAPFSMTYNGQVGTLSDISNKFDYASAQVTVSTISGSAASATDADFANNQFVVKFSLKDAGGSALSATKFTVSAASGKLVQSYSTAGDKFTPVYGDIEVTPASETNEIYVALRNDSGSADRYMMTATSGGKDYVLAKGDVSFSNGTIYQKSIKLYGIGTYTIVGDKAGIFGTAWAPTLTDNDLSLITEGEDVGKYGIALDVSTSEAFEYKIAQDHAWDTTWPAAGNWSYGYKTAKGVLVPGANTLHVVFDPGAGSVAFYPEAETYTVLGTFIGDAGNNWNASYTATNMSKLSDGSYSYKHTHVEPGTYEFKVVGNHSWDWNYGVTANGDNCTYTVTSPCDLIFKFNYRNGAITVEESYPEISINIDGTFSDWDDAYAIDGKTGTGVDAIVSMKAVGDASKLYVYLKMKNASIDYSNAAIYCHKLMIYMGNFDATGTSTDNWKINSNNVVYDIAFDPWFLYNQAVAYKQWSTTIEHKEKVTGDYLETEFSIPRSFNTCMNGDTMWLGLILNTKTADPSGGAWDAIGSAPANYSNKSPYKVFFK